MKKSLFFILFSILMVFMVSGCGEETQGTTSTPQIDPKTLHGTYDIEFFYTDGAKIAVVTTDCSKIKTYVGDDATLCKDPDNDSVKHYGQATIMAKEDGSLKILSKVQMNDGAFNGGLVAIFAKDKKYNFTEFPTIPRELITHIINDNSTGNAIPGTYGRSAKEVVNEEKSKTNTFDFIIEKDGTVVNRLVDNTVMPANVVIRMKKIDDNVTILDPNTKYPTPALNKDDFNDNATYILKNN